AGQPPDQPLAVLPSPPVTSPNNQINIPGQPPESVTGVIQDEPGNDQNTTSNQIPEARLVVLGNSQFATDGWFQQQLNGDVLINSIKWLSKFDATSLPIQPRLATNRRLTMTLLQARLVAWSALVILPLIGFTTAGILWWKRR
ncbi:MAG: ABC transporter, partial [Microcoleaceae cyanobacterium]